MDKFEGKWVHCLSCDSVAIRCDYCENLSCTGGGCEKCHDDFTLICAMTDDKLPRKKGLPKTGGGMDILLRSTSEAALEGIPVDEWIKREHQKLIDSVVAKENESE